MIRPLWLPHRRVRVAAGSRAVLLRSLSALHDVTLRRDRTPLDSAGMLRTGLARSRAAAVGLASAAGEPVGRFKRSDHEYLPRSARMIHVYAPLGIPRCIGQHLPRCVPIVDVR
jgi:hypothetical protein